MTTADIKHEVLTWRLTRYKLVNLAIGLATLLFLEFVARRYYRPYIYANDILDFHIADTLGNSLGTIAGIFLLIGILTSNRTQGVFLIKVITIAFIIYEVAQPVFGKPIDPWDVLATAIFGGISFFVFSFLFRNSNTQISQNARNQ